MYKVVASCVYCSISDVFNVGVGCEEKLNKFYKELSLRPQTVASGVRIWHDILDVESAKAAKTWPAVNSESSIMTCWF